jgi:hypothetical protein
MNQTLRSVGVVGYAAALLLAGSAHAAAAPGLTEEPAHLVLCPAVEPAVADFDGNGIADRVDSINGSALRLTLNSRKHVALAEGHAVCSLVVIDFDNDGDDDLVAFTRRGELLIWRNEGAALVRLSPQRRPTHTSQAWTTAQPTRMTWPAGLTERSLACDLAAVRAYAPSMCLAPSLVPGRLGSRFADSSPSRAPPLS